jgi:phosphomannomutase/phosphoglucomutase
VKCSQTLYDDIAKHGGRPIVWKTGHSLIKTKMKGEGALLAGEMSGHLFFADRYFGYDDAIYAALRLLEILGREGKTWASCSPTCPHTFVTPEIRVDCPDALKFDVVARASRTTRRRTRCSTSTARASTSATARGASCRASNTQPVLVLRFEAKTEARRDAIRAEVERAVEQAELSLVSSLETKIPGA